MLSYTQMAQSVGLIPEKQVQKRASVVIELNPVVAQIDEYLKLDTLSGYIDNIEKRGYDVSEELKDFVKSAEQKGVDESEVIDQVFQKFGYQMPETSEEEQLEKDLLIKASAEITRLEKVAHELMNQVDMMKMAMDLVEANEISPYKSFNELAEQTVELLKSASPDVIKQALELREGIPGIGKVASKPSSNVKLTAEERLLERLQNISSQT